MKSAVKYIGRDKLCWLVVLVLAMNGGCTRNFYRQRADKETYAILQEKEKDPRWRLGAFDVYPDPRSRFADFTKPDRPPTPPDDPFAKDNSPKSQRMKNIDYKEGDGYLDVPAGMRPGQSQGGSGAKAAWAARRGHPATVARTCRPSWAGSNWSARQARPCRASIRRRLMSTSTNWPGPSLSLT